MSDDEGQDQSGAGARSLHQLDVDIAIRLRWVLRDIRAGRLKLLAPSSDDLRSLAELGLVTVDDISSSPKETPPERGFLATDQKRCGLIFDGGSVFGLNASSAMFAAGAAICPCFTLPRLVSGRISHPRSRFYPNPPAIPSPAGFAL